MRKLNQIATILMKRDNLSEDEAIDASIAASRRVVIDGEDPEEVLEDLGLEPDYVVDLMVV